MVFWVELVSVVGVQYCTIAFVLRAGLWVGVLCLLDVRLGDGSHLWFLINLSYVECGLVGCRQ